MVEDRFLKVPFLGISLTQCSTHEFIATMISGAKERSGWRFVTYVNAWCSNVAAKDEVYRQLLLKADCVYADGQAIVWAARFLGQDLPERVNAADFVIDFCRAAADAGISLFLLGGPPGLSSAAAEVFRQAVPAVNIVGTSPGYFPDSSAEAQTLEAVRSAAPDILILGMGVPLQEKWAAAHLSSLNTHTIWCVGAMFEYFAGHRARAPVWVRKAGLEWAFRLILEPRRLWRRYLIGNLVFVARVLAHRRIPQ